MDSANANEEASGVKVPPSRTYKGIRSRHFSAVANLRAPGKTKLQPQTSSHKSTEFQKKHSVLTRTAGSLSLPAIPRVQNSPPSRGPWSWQWVGCSPCNPQRDILLQPVTVHLCLKLITGPPRISPVWRKHVVASLSVSTPHAGLLRQEVCEQHLALMDTMLFAACCLQCVAILLPFTLYLGGLVHEKNCLLYTSPSPRD